MNISDFHEGKNVEITTYVPDLLVGGTMEEVRKLILFISTDYAGYEFRLRYPFKPSKVYHPN